MWICNLGRAHWGHLFSTPFGIRRKWQPTPVLLPGKSHGWRSMVGYRIQEHASTGSQRVGHNWATSLHFHIAAQRLQSSEGWFMYLLSHLVCWTLCNLMGPWTIAHQVPLSMVFQARILEWVVISYSKSLTHSAINAVSQNTSGFPRAKVLKMRAGQKLSHLLWPSPRSHATSFHHFLLIKAVASPRQLNMEGK